MEFDFSSFMQAVSNPDFRVRDKLMHELLSDEIATEMAEVAPRLWAVIHERMLAHKDSDLQLNTVINAAIFALTTWLAAVSPRNQETDLAHILFVNSNVVKAAVEALKK